MPIGQDHAAPAAVNNLTEVADFIRNLALELEQLSEDNGMEGVAACLRAAAQEARRAKDHERMVKLGLKPSRRVG
jgi:hypothetical protein